MQLSDMTGRVLLHTPGCSEELIETKLREAVQDFCKRIDIWTPVIYSEDYAGSDPGLELDDFTIPAGGELLAIDTVRFDVTDLDPQYLEVDWDGAALTILAPPLTTGGTLRITGSIEPTDEATEIPDQPFKRWSRYLAAHAIANLIDMPGMDWYKPSLVPRHEKIFSEGLNEARVYKAKHGTTGLIRSSGALPIP